MRALGCFSRPVRTAGRAAQGVKARIRTVHFDPRRALRLRHVAWISNACIYIHSIAPSARAESRHVPRHPSIWTYRLARRGHASTAADGTRAADMAGDGVLIASTPSESGFLNCSPLLPRPLQPLFSARPAGTWIPDLSPHGSMWLSARRRGWPHNISVRTYDRQRRHMRTGHPTTVNARVCACDGASPPPWPAQSRSFVDPERHPPRQSPPLLPAAAVLPTDTGWRRLSPRCRWCKTYG